MYDFCVLNGTHYEQGVQHGCLLKEAIKKNLENVRKGLATLKCNPAAYAKVQEVNANFIKNKMPSVWEEMRGISVGSGIDFRDILSLNVPPPGSSAILALDYIDKENNDVPGEECSILLARGEATLDGKTYCIKNRDLMLPHVNQAVFKKIYPDGSVIIESAGIGTVVYPAGGMNSYGLGVTTSGAPANVLLPDVSRLDSAETIVNIHQILEKCKTVQDVSRYLQSNSRIKGLNVMAADPTEACLFELTNTEVFPIKPKAGILYHTNHYIHPQTVKYNPSFDDNASTTMRYQRIGEMLRQNNGKLRFQDMLRIMSDHKNGISCLCRHPEVDGGENSAWTASSTMFIIEDFELWTSLGNPCKSLIRTHIK